MSDPTTIAAIVMASTAIIGITGKVLYTFRQNVKSCFGVVFRTPEHSQRGHTPEIQMNDILPNLIPNNPNMQATVVYHNPEHTMRNIYRDRFETIIHTPGNTPNDFNGVEC